MEKDENDDERKGKEENTRRFITSFKKSKKPHTLKHKNNTHIHTHMMEKMKNMIGKGKGEKKKTLRGSVKPHGCHLLVCTGEEDWKAERLESVEKTFYSRLHKCSRTTILFLGM